MTFYAAAIIMGGATITLSYRHFWEFGILRAVTVTILCIFTLISDPLLISKVISDTSDIGDYIPTHFFIILEVILLPFASDYRLRPCCICSIVIVVLDIIISFAVPA